MKDIIISTKAKRFAIKTTKLNNNGYLMLGVHCGMRYLLKSIIFQQINLNKKVIIIDYDMSYGLYHNICFRDKEYKINAVDYSYPNELKEIDLTNNIYIGLTNERKLMLTLPRNDVKNLETFKNLLKEIISLGLKDRIIVLNQFPFNITEQLEDIYEILDLAKKTDNNIIISADLLNYEEKWADSINKVLETVKTTLLFNHEAPKEVRKYLMAPNISDEELYNLRSGEFFMFEDRRLISNTKEIALGFDLQKHKRFMTINNMK